MKKPDIGVDWGTTNLRAFLFDETGDVLETRRSGAGLSSMKGRDFEESLHGVIGDWLDTPARIFISGMAGAREGWVEAPYVPCPADQCSLVERLVSVPASIGEVWIVPGVKHLGLSGQTHVMRGEETQILGSGAGSGTVLLPGTHSKWASVQGNKIMTITTYMTGELYALLREHSVLGRLMRGDTHDDTAFTLGVERGMQPHMNILQWLFSVRTEGLFGRLPPEALSSYLSGLLIGAEISPLAPTGRPDLSEERITLVGTDELCARYQTALLLAGARVVRMVSGEHAAARGLWALAQAKLQEKTSA